MGGLCAVCQQPTPSLAITVCTNCRNILLAQEIAEKIPESEKNQRYDEQWVYPSRSSPGTSHKVSRLGDGFQCSCPVWKFRRAICEHIKDVQQTLALQTAQPAAPAVKRRRFRLEGVNSNE